MKISIGNDHAGPEYKKAIVKCLKQGIWSNKLWNRYFDSVDYPDFAHPVATDVEGKADFGIVICGSGNGIAMTVNKHAN
jgi:ribose 5-phosphate isomerase B